MALSINGRSGSDFDVDDFVALGAKLGVPDRAVRRSLADIAARADRWLPDLGELPFDRGQLAKLRRVISYRRRRLSP
jgi:serine/threonine-protein kinase HipA